MGHHCAGDIVHCLELSAPLGSPKDAMPGAGSFLHAPQQQSLHCTLYLFTEAWIFAQRGNICVGAFVINIWDNMRMLGKVF